MGLTPEAQVRWRRGRNPVIAAGRVKCDLLPLGELYEPTRYPNLPNVFGKLDDERSVLRFTRRFGPLGYGDAAARACLEDDEEGFSSEEEGESLDWILAQASTVRRVSELIHARQAGRSAIEAVLTRYATRYTQEVPACFATTAGDVDHSRRRETLVVDELGVAMGDRVATRLFPNGANPDYQCAAIIAEVVNFNVRDAQWRLEIADDGALSARVAPQSLVGVIWWHLGRWALSGTTRLCARPSCRAPFLALDKRQRYCPGEETMVSEGGRVRSARSMCSAMAYQESKAKPHASNDRHAGLQEDVQGGDE